jgi:hypothetical protein
MGSRFRDMVRTWRNANDLLKGANEMKFTRVLAAAGLALSVAAFAPPVFAQAGGAAGAPGSAGMPGANSGVTGSAPEVQSAPSTGQPGTQASSSAAPIGSGESAWMSESGDRAAQNGSLPNPESTQAETQARRAEVGLQRQITAARAQGYNVHRAQHYKWLGSVSLAKGDHETAMKDFQKSYQALHQQGYASARKQNHENSFSPGWMSSNPNATNMHPNESSRTDY